MIGASSYPLATHIGYKVLQSGGNAADAAIATSLAQIALSAGTSVSYAGIVNVVYYDVATTRVYALNAGFNTLRDESDPLSIPRRDPSGRTALIPGYMAGIESFHQRFGRIPFGDLIAPAIWIAEQGVPLPREIAQQIQNNRALLARLPATKQIFTNKNGDWYTEGETFRQPALAATLRRVAAEGAGYMYRGEWARNFVSVVSRIGGKVAMTDLAAYRADWSEPSRISYRDREVVSIGNDHRGALVALGSLKAAERARLKQYGHFSSSAESLRYLIQISRIHLGLVSQSSERRANVLPGFDPAIHSQLSEETADRVLARIREGRVEISGSASSTPHTAPIVVIDAKGNVASLVPTVMMAGWGHTGLFVDGVSIPDTAKFLQPSIARAGPGARLADPTTPILILRNGKPVLAFGSLGGNGLPTLVLQSLVSLLEFDMDVTAAANQPYTLGAYLSGDNDEAARRREVILSGSFPPSVIDKLQALGQPVQVVKESPQEAYWLAIQIDPQTRKLTAGASQELPAVFESY